MRASLSLGRFQGQQLHFKCYRKLASCTARTLQQHLLGPRTAQTVATCKSIVLAIASFFQRIFSVFCLRLSMRLSGRPSSVIASDPKCKRFPGRLRPAVRGLRAEDGGLQQEGPTFVGSSSSCETCTQTPPCAERARIQNSPADEQEVHLSPAERPRWR